MSRLGYMPLVVVTAVVLANAGGALVFKYEQGRGGWVAWGDRVHSSPEELRSWLAARGGSYDEWAAAHPKAAARLERLPEPPLVSVRVPPAVQGRTERATATLSEAALIPPAKYAIVSTLVGLLGALLLLSVWARGFRGAASSRVAGGLAAPRLRAPPTGRGAIASTWTASAGRATRGAGAALATGVVALTRAAAQVFARARVESLWVPIAVASPIMVAVVLWFASLQRVKLDDLSDVGLVGAMPRVGFAALVLLTCTFTFLAADAKRHRALLLTTLVAFVVMAYGAPAMIAEAPRFPVTWRHAGVVEYITRVGAVDPRIDAYFNWPGFFVLGAFVSEAARLDLLRVANWFPTFLNVLYALPLWVMFSRLTQDQRQRWLALWFFFVGNWVAQDYVSPQGVAFFVYLAVCAAVLTVFTDGRTVQQLTARLKSLVRGSAVAPESPPLGRVTLHFGSAQRAGIVVVIVAAFAAVATGHQLTPFAMVVAAAALALTGVSSTRLLPVLMMVIIGLWSAFMAVAYFKGHFGALLSNVGQGAVESNVSARLSGSPGHMTVVHTRLALTLALWTLAGVGALLAVRRRQPIVPLLALSAAPFLLVPLQPYGGEMLMRVYLFSLPFTAFLAASAFSVSGSRRRLYVSTAAVTATALVFTGAFLVARYGNERMDQFKRTEVAAVEAVYAHAPPGSRIVAATRSVPWKLRDYEKHRYLVIQDSWPLSGDDAAADELVRSLTTYFIEDARPSYVILSRSQSAEGEIMGAAEAGFLGRLDSAFRRSARFRILQSSNDASVFVFVRRST